MIAAAEIPGSRPMFCEMPIRPMPTVPTTVHELPMLAETIAQISTAVT